MFYCLTNDTELKEDSTGYEFIIVEFFSSNISNKYLNLTNSFINLKQPVFIISLSVFHISESFPFLY